MKGVVNKYCVTDHADSSEKLQQGYEHCASPGSQLPAKSGGKRAEQKAEYEKVCSLSDAQMA